MWRQGHEEARSPATIRVKVAIAIDTSTDDGVMIAGSVRGQLQSAPNPVAASASGSYAETGTNSYLMCRQL
jgi:hypothetical protein